MIGADDVNIEKFGRHLPPIVGKQLVLKLVEQYICDKPTETRFHGQWDCSCVPSIERFHGAMLFVDISGFTALSQRLNVDELRIHINGYFKKILEIVFKYNGEVVKFAGDALFIIWQTKSSSTEEGEHFASERRKAVASASACGMEVNQTCSRYKVSFLEQNLHDSWLASALTSSKTTKPVIQTHETTPSSDSVVDDKQPKPENSTYLNVHAGVSVGTMAGIDVGANDRWEYLLVGEPLVSVAKAESEAAVAELVMSPDAHTILHEFTADFQANGFTQYCQQAMECHSKGETIPLLPCGCQITSGGFFKVNQIITGGSNLDADDEPDPEYELAFYAELMSNVTTAYDTMKSVIYENYNAIVERQSRLLNTGGGSAALEETGSIKLHSQNDKDDKLFSHYLHWTQSCIVDDLVRHVHEADRGTFALKQLSRVRGLTDLADKNLSRLKKSPHGSPRGASHSSHSDSNSGHISTHSSSGKENSFSSHYTPASASINFNSSSISVSGKLSGSASTDSFVNKIRSISDSKHRRKRKHDRTLKQDATLTAELRSVLVLFVKLDVKGSLELHVDPVHPSVQHFSEQESKNLEEVLENNRGTVDLPLAPGGSVVIEGFNFLKRTERELEEDLKLLTKFQSCMEVMTRIFLSKGGQMRQFIVDDKGTVCIGTFGLRGAANTDNAAAAIETAQDIIDQLNEIGIKSGVGITSGKAYCGLVGSAQRHEYAVMGPSINLSARLMAKSEWGEILCSEEARTRDRTHAFDSCGAIQAKGYELPVPIFKPLVRLHAEETADDLHRQSSTVGQLLLNHRPSGISFDVKDPHAQISTPERLVLQQQQSTEKRPHRHSLKKRHRSLCVGREDESEAVLHFLCPQIFPEHEALEDVTGPLPSFDVKAATRLCVVQANSGIGKSNFIDSITQKLRDVIRTDRKINFSLFQSKSTSYHNSEPFGSWKPIIDKLLSSSAPKDISVKSKEQLILAGLDFLTESMPDALVQLKPLLSSIYLVRGLVENEATKKLSGAARLAKISELLSALIQHYVDTNNKVAVFMMDDLHAFDSASWQLLKKIYKSNTGVMVLGSYPVMTLSERDTSCDSLSRDFADRPEQYLRLELQAFEEEASLVYCQFLMDEHSIIGVNPSTFSLIHEIAGGNPLYIGELVAAFADRFRMATRAASDITKVSGSLIFTEMIKSFSTVRIEEVIFFRFDQLEPACQLLLKLASVVCSNGAKFSLSILSYMMLEDDSPNGLQLSVDESRGIKQGGIFQLVRSMSTMGAAFPPEKQETEAQQLNATNFCLLKTIKTLLKRREFVQIASSGTSSAGSAPKSHSGGGRRGSKFVDTRRSAIRSSMNSDVDFEDEQDVMIDTLEVNNDEDAEYFHSLEFEFRVHLEQVSVYSMMLNDQKESLHDRVACYLEKKSVPDANGVVVSPPRPSSLQEEGYHWEHAANWSAAMNCFYRSALILESVGAFEENFTLLTAAYRMLNAMRRDAGVNESAMLVVVPEIFKVLFTSHADAAAGGERVTSVENDLVALTFRYKASLAPATDNPNSSSGGSTTLTKEVISKIFYSDCDLLELGINVIVKLAQVSLILTYRFSIISRLYEEALQMILLTMKSETLFGKHHVGSPAGASSLKANGAVTDGIHRSPPKRRTSFHVGTNSFADSNDFGLRDPTMCFPILSGISALYRNNLLPDDANHGKEVTVYNLFVTLAQSSPLPQYQMHLLIGFSFKRSIYADVGKRQESIHYCDIIRHFYDYDMHSAEAVKIYGNDRIPYTFSINIQLMLMMGQVVRALNYLEYTCELIPRIAHLHSQGITVIGLCWQMVQMGRSHVAFEMYRSYVDGLETRRVFSFFNPTNTLFVAWLKLETLMESFKKTQNVSSLADNVPCEKELEVMAQKFFLTGESRPINMFALDSFGTNTEFVCARMCFIRAQIKLLTNQYEETESLLKLALQYINHGITCNRVNLKNSYGTYTSLLLKAEVLKFFADFLGSSDESASAVLLSEAKDTVKMCLTFGQEQEFDFISLSAAVKWKELGFSSENDGESSQLLSWLSKIVNNTTSATASVEATLSEELVRDKPYFMIGDIREHATFDGLVEMFPTIAELRSLVIRE